VPLGKAEFETQVAVLDITQPCQRIAKQRHDRFWIGGCVDQQHADERALAAMLEVPRRAIAPMRRQAISFYPLAEARRELPHLYGFHGSMTGIPTSQKSSTLRVTMILL